MKELIQFTLFLMGKFNLRFEQIESPTASWNGLCATFEGPLYSDLKQPGTQLIHCRYLKSDRGTQLVSPGARNVSGMGEDICI